MTRKIKNDIKAPALFPKGRRRSDIALLRDIGSNVETLLAAVGRKRGDRARKGPPRTPLVEQALDAAAEVESYFSEQRARISYLENLTLTDELTGLRNRRGFNDEMRRTLAAAARYGERGVLVICDLDGFKSINDNYGHQVGDRVLRHVARVIEAQVRETDIVARLGGDEFAVLMVQTGWRHGAKRAQMLYQVLNRTIVTHDGQQIAVRASIGVEPFGPNDEESRLVARADMAMYVNKRKKTGADLDLD